MINAEFHSIYWWQEWKLNLALMRGGDTPHLPPHWCQAQYIIWGALAKAKKHV